MKKFTLNQKRFIKEYLKNGGNGTEAALKVYDAKSRTDAANIASQNLKKPTIKEAIEQALESQEVTPEAVAKVIKEGLGAKKLEWDMSNFTYKESIYPDHLTRLKTVELYMKLTGATAPTKHEHSGLLGVLAAGTVEDIRSRLIPRH